MINKVGNRKHYNPDNPTLNAALQSQDADKWLEAINTEYKNLGVENTWEAVLALPPGKPWIPSHMVLVRQRYATGEIKKYKARLVANGSRQRYFYFDENSSPTARETTVKFFYAKTAALNRRLRTFDVKGAYLKSDIDEEIYMLLPKKNVNDESQYVILKKSLYGLKQAGKLWFENIRGVLMKMGFEQSTGDECAYSIYNDKLKDIIDVVIHVDDILSSSMKTESTDWLFAQLKIAYGEVNETTTTETHLGMRWEVQNNGDIVISQPGYIKKIVTELKLEHSNNEILPYCQSTAITVISVVHKEEHTIQLRKILGLLNHAAIHTRPDILYCVVELQTKVSVATDTHIRQALHIVKYLKGTSTLGLRFSGNTNTEIEASIDAARDLTHPDSKGHSGICVRLDNHKTAPFHTSKKQSLVTRSANEAEIFAIDQGCLDIQWIREMLEFLHCKQNKPTIIYEDNEAAIGMLTGMTNLGTKSKHIKWRYNYALQTIKENTVRVEWINTEKQIADILTKKNFTNKQFYFLRSEILNCENSKTGL